MLVEHPVVIIAVPAYNEERYIRDTLASLRDQTFANFRVVISDNASTDCTGDICRDFCSADERFVYVRQEINLGATGNFQWLLDNTSSPFFMWLGAHDLLALNFLEQAVANLDASPHAALCFSDVRLIDETGRHLRDKNGGNYHEINGAPSQRYSRLMVRLKACEAINNLFRRSSLAALHIKQVLEGDRIVLCHAIYRGHFLKIPAPLYIRRMQASDTEMVAARMKRLAGNTTTKVRRIDTLRAYKSDFDHLNRSFGDQLYSGSLFIGASTKAIVEN